MSKLIMLCGIPTSGKSTYVKKIKTLNEWKNSVVLSTDNYIEREAKFLRTTYNEIFKDTINKAEKALKQDLKAAIIHNFNIIWDQTNLSSKTRSQKLKLLPSYYDCDAIYFPITLDEALKRNHNREGKFIPESILTKMYNEFVIPTLNEGFNYIEQNKI